MSLQSVTDSQILKEKINRNMLYVGIFTVVMLFAAFTSAVILRSADSGWTPVKLPGMFWYSTAIILISSVTMSLGLNAAKNNQFSKIKFFLSLTILLGLGFGFSQLLGWKEMTQNNIFLTGPNSSVAGSYIYFISFLHLVHILAGLAYLLTIWFKSLQNRYNSGNMMGIRHAAIFWHFLDALWIYLFLFLFLFN